MSETLKRFGIVVIVIIVLVVVLTIYPHVRTYSYKTTLTQDLQFMYM